MSAVVLKSLKKFPVGFSVAVLNSGATIKNPSNHSETELTCNKQKTEQNQLNARKDDGERTAVTTRGAEFPIFGIEGRLGSVDRFDRIGSSDRRGIASFIRWQFF